MSDHKKRDYPISNSTYDVLKYIAQIVLPGLAALYIALAALWGFTHVREIVGTITAVDTFLGLLLQLTTKSYNNSDAKYDGQIEVAQVEADKKLFSLNLHSDPEKLDQKDEVLFKITSK